MNLINVIKTLMITCLKCLFPVEIQQSLMYLNRIKIKNNINNNNNNNNNNNKIKLKSNNINNSNNSIKISINNINKQINQSQIRNPIIIFQDKII